MGCKGELGKKNGGKPGRHTPATSPMMGGAGGARAAWAPCCCRRGWGQIRLIGFYSVPAPRDGLGGWGPHCVVRRGGARQAQTSDGVRCTWRGGATLGGGKKLAAVYVSKFSLTFLARVLCKVFFSPRDITYIAAVYDPRVIRLWLEILFGRNGNLGAQLFRDSGLDFDHRRRDVGGSPARAAAFADVGAGST